MMAKMKQQLSDTGRRDVKRIKIEHIMTHAVCEAKAFLYYEKNAPSEKMRAQEMTKAALRELLLLSVRSGVFPKRKEIERVIHNALDGIITNREGNHIEKIIDMAESIGNVFTENELTIIGGPLPIEVSYEGIIIQAVCDGFVVDGRRGYQYPVIVDISLTRYEPNYNPLLYHADVLSSFYNAKLRTTDICVVGFRKRWHYRHGLYHGPVYASIVERAEAILSGYSPFRFGWWCAGCEYRGICFKLTD